MNYTGWEKPCVQAENQVWKTRVWIAEKGGTFINPLNKKQKVKTTLPTAQQNKLKSKKRYEFSIFHIFWRVTGCKQQSKKKIEGLQAARTSTLVFM
jgi:hypothetical protein